jgi:hypothetical protein
MLGCASAMNALGGKNGRRQNYCNIALPNARKMTDYSLRKLIIWGKKRDGDRRQSGV